MVIGDEQLQVLYVCPKMLSILAARCLAPLYDGIMTDTSLSPIICNLGAKLQKRIELTKYTYLFLLIPIEISLFPLGLGRCQSVAQYS
jgi:hypothetical protein